MWGNTGRTAMNTGMSRCLSRATVRMRSLGEGVCGSTLAAESQQLKDTRALNDLPIVCNWAWISDWDKYPLLLDGEQDGSLHRKFFSGLKYIRRANPSRNGPVNVLYKRVYQNKR